MSLYSSLWRRLPGSRAVKVVEAAGLVASVVLILFLWVFPLIAGYLPFSLVTVAP